MQKISLLATLGMGKRRKRDITDETELDGKYLGSIVLCKTEALFYPDKPGCEQNFLLSENEIS